MTSRHVMLGVSAIVFAASAAMTIATSASMTSMGGMPMPGGWTMSHMWMLMPGQSWLGATASFVSMWAVMMVAMMLPSLMPTLLRYHESLGKRVGTLWAALLVGTVGFSYFVIWAAVGAIVFPFGVALADAAMRQARVANAGPTAVAVVLIAAGVLHGSAWKERHLARCRDTSDAGVAARIDARAAWHYGLCLGRHCIRSCAGLTVVGLCLGLMDARVMAAIAIAVTAERLAPNGVRVARVVSVLVVVLGMSILVGAMALSHD